MSETEFRPTPEQIPGQQLPYPASQEDLTPQPDSDLSNYRPAGKLQDKVALITGGDSGIGRAVAIAFAMEGADVAIFYNEHDDDASVTLKRVEAQGKQCLTIKGDVRDPQACRHAVEDVLQTFGHLNTPNIPATMPKEMVDHYDTDSALGRAAQPEELAPA